MIKPINNNEMYKEMKMVQRNDRLRYSKRIKLAEVQQRREKYMSRDEIPNAEGISSTNTTAKQIMFSSTI